MARLPLRARGNVGGDGRRRNAHRAPDPVRGEERLGRLFEYRLEMLSRDGTIDPDHNMILAEREVNCPPDPTTGSCDGYFHGWYLFLMVLHRVGSTTTATYLIIGDFRKASCNKVFDDRPDFRSLCIMVNIYAYLAKPHERPHTDPSHD